MFTEKQVEFRLHSLDWLKMEGKPSVIDAEYRSWSNGMKSIPDYKQILSAESVMDRHWYTLKVNWPRFTFTFVSPRIQLPAFDFLRIRLVHFLVVFINPSVIYNMFIYEEIVFRSKDLKGLWNEFNDIGKVSEKLGSLA